MILVNFGCGYVFHPDWVNLDTAPASPLVGQCDVQGRLFFSDMSADVVYHSHLLEHLEGQAGQRFMKECHRILKPGGTVRVVVPDLEAIARSYLSELNATLAGRDSTLCEWSRMELTDQASRARSGGAMIPFVQSLDPGKLAVVRQRAGAEIDGILKLQSDVKTGRHVTMPKLWLRARLEVARFGLYAIGGKRMKKAFEEGWFRQQGEIHRVMYDRVLLSRLLEQCGFVDAAVTTADQSRIPGYAAYGLDQVAGAVRKPDSLFMEATRP